MVASGSGGPIELSGTVLVLMSQRCKCIQRFSLSGSPAFKADVRMMYASETWLVHAASVFRGRAVAADF